MIYIPPRLNIPSSEILLSYVQAAGPGGQNVNKVATAVELRFDVRSSRSLPEEIKSRLLSIAGHRVNSEGVFILFGRRFRTQEQNRQEVLARFSTWLQKAQVRPAVRKETRPTRASQARRIAAKKLRGRIKNLRKSPAGKD